MLLANAGIDFEAVPADIDERRLQTDSGLAAPDEIALLLAREKALMVSSQKPGRYVAGADQTLGGSWTSAMQEAATFSAAALWGFALWWIAAAAVITRHAGRAALTYTPADWGFVFPSAAMVIATLTLGRRWESALLEVIGFGLGVLLAVVWVAVATGAIISVHRGRRRKA